MQQLLDSVLLTALRHSVDDPVLVVASAALQALGRLLVSDADDACLQRCCLWYGGDEQPQLNSQVSLDDADEQQQEEMTDAELVSIFSLLIHSALYMSKLTLINYHADSHRCY